MSTKQCSRGHVYDASHDKCPFCQALGISENEIIDGPVINPTVPIKEEKSDNSMEVTQVVYNEGSTELVVGWLVCTKGAEYGKGLPLYVNNNFIGSASDQDIQLADKKVSPNHFAIGFDPSNNDYFAFMQTDAHGIVRVNGKPLDETIILQAGDKIQVGDTELVFIPLDQKFVKWDYEYDGI